MTILWNRRKYSKDEFISAWLSSDSIAEVARKLNLTIYGSTYKTLKLTAEELGLNRDHMTGQAHLRGKSNPWTPKRPIEEILTENSSYGSSGLKKRLFREGLKEKVCELCGLTEWRGRPISLHLDHINGINTDNRIENLRILCPNCHSQTETYCRGHKGLQAGVAELGHAGVSKTLYRSDLDAGSNPAARTNLCHCGKAITSRATTCRNHVPKAEKIDWPPLEELVAMVSEMGYSAAGRRLGVSDNAIRKRLKKLQSR